MFKTIDEWVDYVQTIHHREIELGLDRVARVYEMMYPHGLDFKIISVAGTNGKGSTCELISSIYTQSNLKVGKFTSPHIVKFNERYTINGIPVSDELIIDSFSKIEKARGDIPLTYFEFGALLAIVIFDQQSIDVAVMEVGLGGRLDAVNILDADLSIVTSISIDHTAWLGDTIELISLEKIAISRSGRPCLIGMESPSDGLLEYCKDNKIELYRYGEDFVVKNNDESSMSWTWGSVSKEIDCLDYPFQQIGCQLINASLAIKAVSLLSSALSVSNESIRKGISVASLSGRCQVYKHEPLIILDVSHNCASVQRLAEFVNGFDVKGRTYAVCGMLSDKEISDSLSHLLAGVDEWHFAAINNERAASVDELSAIHHSLAADFGMAQQSYSYESIKEAFVNVKNKLNSDDCLIVFGSFFVVSDIISFEIDALN